MPKISIIIPVYGVEKYIERCAQSLFNQTLEDIEFIFVDDYTYDNSTNILRRVIELYPQRKNYIKILHHDINKGLPTARQTGIQIATGDYVIHCDSDDWVDLTMYEKMYNKAIEEDADVVVCDYYRSNATINTKIRVLEISKDCDKVFRALLCHKFQPAVWNKLVRRELYDKVSVYPTCNMGEDLVLMVQIFNNCKKISYLRQPLYYYYYNSESITGLNSYESVSKRVVQLKENVLLIEKYLVDEGLCAKYKDEILNLKVFTKCESLQCAQDKRWYMLWKEVFPELRLYEVLFSRNISIKGKALYLLSLMGLYHKK